MAVSLKIKTTLLAIIFANISMAVGKISMHKASKAPEKSNITYCSFFNNRAPQAQPGLKNCTWFKENSCCLQQEIEATFGKMKPLKGASLQCQKYINYLMCYICAPTQNIFYQNERLTVCEGFCDSLYNACGSAILKGSVIKDLYPNGKKFCESRRFEVNTISCFSFDPLLDSTNSQEKASACWGLLLIALLTSFYASPSGLIINTEGKVKRSVCFGDPVKRENIKRSNPVAQTFRIRQILTMFIRFKYKWVVSYKTGVFVWITTFMTFCHCFEKTLAITYDVPTFNNDNIKKIAEGVSERLTQFAKNGLQYEELQRIYDDAEYVTEYKDGGATVTEVRNKLGMCSP